MQRVVLLFRRPVKASAISSHPFDFDFVDFSALPVLQPDALSVESDRFLAIFDFVVLGTP